MKKQICLLMALLLLLSLAACKPPVDDPTEAPEPTETTTHEEQQTTAPDVTEASTLPPTGPSMSLEQTDDEWPLEVYGGVYRLEEESGDQMHCLEVFDLGNMLVLEHSLYMEGSLYSFWVEEFWPDDQAEWNDLYAPMPGMTQTFSIMTSDTQYDDAPRACSLLYHDSGIAIRRDEDVMEYYLMDELAVGIHNDADFFRSQLTGAPGGEAAGRWYSWNGHTFILAEFDLDGSFRWIHKEIGTPIQVYQGAWTNTDGRIQTLSEKLGAGTQPYFVELTWEYSGQEGYLCLKEAEPLLLECYGGTDYFYPTDFVRQLPFYQAEALETEAAGITLHT